MPSPALTYASYLALPELLAAQRTRSDEHDELLFIVIHQVYELWFKQMLHELDALQRQLDADLDARALGTLGRLLAILKTVVAQVDVLETMTPLQFSAFRSRLEAASGFQSAQFRQLEARLGRRDRQMLAPYRDDPASAGRIEAALETPSVFAAFLAHVAREGFAIPLDVLERSPELPYDGDERVQAALVELYRSDRTAAQLAERFVDLDEGLQEWRYRHVQMVRRTIGDKPGTGGSSGEGYLRGTLVTPVFPDLWAIRSAL